MDSSTVTSPKYAHAGSMATASSRAAVKLASVAAGHEVSTIARKTGAPATGPREPKLQTAAVRKWCAVHESLAHGSSVTGASIARPLRLPARAGGGGSFCSPQRAQAHDGSYVATANISHSATCA